jgi:Holliday junction DNA helicase RuvA
MIAYICGILKSFSEEKVIINVSGVGYSAFISSKDIAKIHQKLGKEVEFFITTIVREDSITLYGFLAEEEQNWFDILCKVKGVGHKMALKILGQSSISDIKYGIKNQDKSIFQNISGIGPKLALRIVTELKDMAKDFDENYTLKNQTSPQFTKIRHEAIMALENLGYKKSNITKIIEAELSENIDISVEELITKALRSL